MHPDQTSHDRKRGWTRWLLLALLCPALAQAQSSPLEAHLDFGTGYTRKPVDLLGVRGGNLSFQVQGSTTIAQAPLETVAGIRFTMTDAMVQGIREAQGRSWVNAIRALYGPATQVLPYLKVPDTNAEDLLDPYAQALLELNQLDKLRDLYDVLSKAGNRDTARRATAWLGYLKAREGGQVDLEALFGKPDVADQDELLNALREIAYGYQALGGKQYQQASDHLARVVASANLEMRLYPEALFLAGQAYDGLALGLQDKQQANRDLQIERELLSERVTVGRKLQAEAERSGKPAPTEEEILAALDRDAVAARVPDLPPMIQNPYARNAQRMYQLVQRLYPGSLWDQKAAEHIKPGFRLLRDEASMTVDLSESQPPSPDNPNQGEP